MSKDAVSPDGEITIYNELHLTGRRKDVGATREFYTLLAQHVDLFRQVVEFVDYQTSIDALRPVYRVMVNGDFNWPGALMNAGLDSSCIPSRGDFPLQGGGLREADIEIFRFWRNESAEKIIVALRQIGYRPIDIQELLALKAQAREAFLDHTPILALNQQLNGYSIAIERVGDGYYIGAELVERQTRLSWRVGAVKLQFAA
jgi:hypothetical protein